MNRYLSGKAVFRDTMLIAGLAFGFGINLPVFAAAPVPKAHSADAGQAMSDSNITAQVKLRLADVKGLDKSDIGVTTNNGVVTLSGTVSDPHAKFAAVAAAISVEGVRILDDELKTPPNYKLAAETKTAKGTTKHGASDSRITAQVKDLLAQSVSPRYKVDVATTDGVVFLRGDLANRDAVERVKGLVEKVDGVKSVNMLGVDAPFITMTY